MGAQDGRVSVVVITRNRAGELDGTLRKLGAMPGRPPIVVVDNASDDGTPSLVEANHPEVCLLRSEHNLGAAGRNLGVRRAQTPYVAFSDDDSWWALDALPRAADAFDAHPGLGLIAACVKVGPTQRVDATSADMAASPLVSAPGLPGTAVLGFIACGAIVRRSAYLDVGGFHPRLGIGAEEQLLAIDLWERGYRLQYLPQIVAFHHPSANRDRALRRRRTVRNESWTAWLRRPLRGAWRVTANNTRRSLSDPDVRAGVVDALRHGGWVLRERRVVGADLEAQLRLLER